MQCANICHCNACPYCHHSRIENIEAKLECGFSKLTNAIIELNDIVKKNNRDEAYDQLNAKWNQIERIPCMCCDKTSNSFDKSFFSKEEGRELLCTASETNLMANSESLQCLDHVDEQTSTRDINDSHYLLLAKEADDGGEGVAACAMTKSQSTTCSCSLANTLDCVSSIDTCKNILTSVSHSEPALNIRLGIRNFRFQSSQLELHSRSLSQVWLKRIIK